MTDTVAAVRSFLDAFYGSRWDELLPLLAPDALYIDPLLPEPVRGHDAIRDVLIYCHEWGLYTSEITSVFGTDHLVAVEQRIKGTVKKAPEGMSDAVVGRSFEFLEADVFEFNDAGLIIRETIYADALTLSHQLGEAF
jgi:hypothetical protein